MTSKPKTVTIPQAEYSALLGVVAAHRADAGKSPSKVLEYYDSVTRKPAPEVDHGGRVYYATEFGVWEARKNVSSACLGCGFSHQPYWQCQSGKRLKACHNDGNGGRGHRTLHPVRAVG